MRPAAAAHRQATAARDARHCLQIIAAVIVMYLPLAAALIKLAP